VTPGRRLACRPPPGTGADHARPTAPHDHEVVSIARLFISLLTLWSLLKRSRNNGALSAWLKPAPKIHTVDELPGSFIFGVPLAAAKRPRRESCAATGGWC